MTRVLLIKTSALGDVVSCLPIATDLSRHVPNLTLDWLVEEGLAELPRLHPAVNRVIPVATRRWRRRPFAADTRAEFRAFRLSLAANAYDRIIDAQGLIRSGWLSRYARGPRSGYDRHSIREPLASLFYDQRHPVSFSQHAVARMRRLAGLAMGYEPPAEADYGLAVAPLHPSWLPDGVFLVALHATARAEKLWNETNWIALGRRAAAEGLPLVLPWATVEEQDCSRRIASAVPGAIVPPKMSLAEIAGVMAGASAVVGVDTGLAHLAAAVGVPVLALFVATWPAFYGVVGPGFIANLGGPGQAPDVDAAWTEVRRALQAGRSSGTWRLPAEALARGRGGRSPRSDARAVVDGR